MKMGANKHPFFLRCLTSKLSLDLLHYFLYNNDESEGEI